MNSIVEVKRKSQWTSIYYMLDDNGFRPRVRIAPDFMQHGSAIFPNGLNLNRVFDRVDEAVGYAEMVDQFMDALIGDYNKSRNTENQTKGQAMANENRVEYYVGQRVLYSNSICTVCEKPMGRPAADQWSIWIMQWNRIPLCVARTNVKSLPNGQL